jgi:hypothetical protein
MGLLHRVRHAVDKADKADGAKGELRSPKWVSELVYESKSRDLTEEETSRLEGFISDPIGKAVHVSVLYPRESKELARLDALSRKAAA